MVINQQKSPLMKLRFKINFRFTSEILDICFQLSNEKDTELKPYEESDDTYNQPEDPNNQSGENIDPGWLDDDPDEYDDDPDGLNWPPINYN